MMIRWLIVFATTTALTGCGLADAKSPEPLPKIEACFVTDDQAHPVILETASDSKTRQKGLMGRQALAENAGMLFSYDYERRPEQGFWMYKTMIPLDIAFLDKRGTIVSIRQMHPCASSRSNDCPGYPAGAAYWHAVEMNLGYFNRRNIAIGDHLTRGEAADCSP
ncbi:DUF192 domain-containing protein [Marinobacter sp. VGCF2001]|uniref:DUF192 domain-containing protein n=1 Tax=Marinobacter sp. VGCF2001 TaxID=3417189 RepID=UPI003CE83BB1